MGRSQSKELSRKTALLLPVLAIIGPFSMDFYLSGLPHLTKYFHASTSAGQGTLTACLIGLAFGQIISGPISDQYGRKRPLIWAMAIYTLASLACAIAPSILIFTLCRLVQGLAGGASNLLHSLRKPLRDRKFTALAAMIGLQGSGIFIYLAGSTFAFQQIYGLSATMFATVFAVNSAGLTLSARIAGRISKRRNSAAALQAAILITLTGAFGATIAAWRHYSVWAFGISLFLILCGLGMNGPASSSLAMQEQSENAGAASAILGLMRFSLGGMAAPIVGAVASDIAFSTGVMEFGAALLSVTIFFTIWKRD
jgi:MFS family permease